MNLFTIFVLSVVLLVITTSVEGRRRNRQSKRQRRNKKKEPKDPDTNKKDPADISSMFSNCSDSGSISTLFGGMFLSETKLDEIVNATQEELNSNSKTRSAKTSYIKSNRISKKIATIETFSTSPLKSESTSETCCETELRLTAPGVVIVDNKEMSVIHMNHSYQYVNEGVCVRPAAQCRSIGICTQRYKMAYMLLYDPELDGKVNPPVRFANVPVKSHCECMNVGRVMK